MTQYLISISGSDSEGRQPAKLNFRLCENFVPVGNFLDRLKRKGAERGKREENKAQGRREREGSE